MTKVFEPDTNTIKDTSQDISKTMMETSIENNKTLEKLNNKLIEVVKDRGVLASCLLSLLSKDSNPEHTSQFKLLKGPSSNMVNNLLINKTIPVTLYNILLRFRGTEKEFKLQGDPLNKKTNKNYNVNLAKFSDKKIKFDTAKEIYFD